MFALRGVIWHHQVSDHAALYVLYVDLERHALPLNTLTLYRNVGVPGDGRGRVELITHPAGQSSGGTQTGNPQKPESPICLDTPIHQATYF